MGSNSIYLRQLTLRESEQSQLVVLCCLALFDESLICVLTVLKLLRSI